MTKLHRSAIMPHTDQQMFDLVNQIEHYPDFLPWCQSVNIISRTSTEVIASITIARFGFHKTFTTKNQLDAPRSMVMTLVDGPFKHLESEWRFEALDEAHCQVTFDIDYEVSSGWIDKAFGSVFHQLASSMVEAFCQRADEVYGKSD